MNWNIVLLAVLLMGCVVEETDDEEKRQPEGPTGCDASLCATDCASHGWCSTFESNGECYCVASSSADCEQSIDCELDGMCSFIDGWCHIAGSWDCEKTIFCQNECYYDSERGGCGFDGEKCYDSCP